MRAAALHHGDQVYPFYRSSLICRAVHRVGDFETNTAVMVAKKKVYDDIMCKLENKIGRRRKEEKRVAWSRSEGGKRVYVYQVSGPDIAPLRWNNLGP